MTTRADTTPPESRLIELLGRQESIVERLATLAARQRPLIDRGRTTDLLRLLAERQVLIDEFVTTNDDVGRLTEDLQRRRDAILSRSVEGCISRIARRLNEVLATDERDCCCLVGGAP